MQGDKRAQRQAMVVMVVAATSYCLTLYHAPFGNRAWDDLLFYLAVPLVTILVLRQNPLEWGLGIGHWKRTLCLIVLGALGLAIVLLIAVRMPVFQEFYAPFGPRAGEFWLWLGRLAISMLAWEFFFRAFMLFGLEPALGELAIYVQMIPFAISHAGKPELETLSSIAGGIIIGYIVRYCRSFWPAFVLHMIIGVVMHLL